MKASYVIAVLTLLILPVGAGEVATPPIRGSGTVLLPSFREVGRGSIVSFRVNNGWAGENFALYSDKEGSPFVMHTVYGSGRPVVSNERYEVTDTKRSAKRNEYPFRIPYEKEQELTFTIRRVNSTYALYLFGRELKTVVTTEPHNKPSGDDGK